MQWLRHYLNHSFYSQKTPHIWPTQASYGVCNCALWGFREYSWWFNSTILYILSVDDNTYSTTILITDLNFSDKIFKTQHVHDQVKDKSEIQNQPRIPDQLQIPGHVDQGIQKFFLAAVHDLGIKIGGGTLLYEKGVACNQ